jgi:hypothetical protein
LQFVGFERDVLAQPMLIHKLNKCFWIVFKPKYCYNLTNR